jgi:hypothetical protein
MLLTNRNIANSIARQSVGGLHQPRKETFPELSGKSLPKAVKGRLGKSVMSEDAYLSMVQYAKWLPRGKRQLRLNIPKLRDLLASNDLKDNPLTKISGLNSGGKLAFAANQSTKQVQKLLTQAGNVKGVTIMNKNRLKSESNLKSGFNPNYTSFKNNIRL